MSGTTTIDLPAGRYVIPATLEFDFQTDLVGASAGNTVIDGGNAVTVIDVANPATVAISGVTISGGTTGRPSCRLGFACPPENGMDGGGVDNLGTLTMTDAIVSGNQTAGGGTAVIGPVLCTGGCSPYSGPDGGNGGNGAGIYNGTGATLTVDDSTISNNTTGPGFAGGVGASGTGGDVSAGQTGGDGGDGGVGAGIYNDSGGTLTIENSTISGNTTGAGGAAADGTDATASGESGGNSGNGGDGGNAAGIENVGTLAMTDSTISGNTTGAGGDGATPGLGGSVRPGWFWRQWSGARHRRQRDHDVAEHDDHRQRSRWRRCRRGAWWPRRHRRCQQPELHRDVVDPRHYRRQHLGLWHRPLSLRAVGR